MKTTRRYLIGQGVRLFGVGGPLALAAWAGFPGLARAIDWKGLLGRKEEKPEGFGTVKEMQGRATAAGRALQVGSRVDSGEEIRSDANSWLILSLSDNSILRIAQRTVFTLELSKRKTGFFKLLVGAVLTVVPKGNRFLVHMPTATIGIKGTVFFHQIYHEDEKVAADEKRREVTIPEGVSEYFCLCNGLADFLKDDMEKPFFTDDASYHNSYFINPSLPEPLVEAPQLNHTDKEIEQLIDLQDGPQHSRGFLLDYATSGAEP